MSNEVVVDCELDPSGELAASVFMYAGDKTLVVSGPEAGRIIGPTDDAGDKAFVVSGVGTPYDVVVSRSKGKGPKNRKVHYVNIEMNSGGTKHEFVLDEHSAREFKRGLTEQLSAIFKERRRSAAPRVG